MTVAIDLSHTVRVGACTGIQRVARSLFMQLSEACGPVQAICYDEVRRNWRLCNQKELENIRFEQDREPSVKRGAGLSIFEKWIRRVSGSGLKATVDADLRAMDLFIAPEVFSPEVGLAYEALFKHVNGPKVALFHDAYPLRGGEFTPVKTVERFPGYLRELQKFDFVLPISEASREDLLYFWDKLRVGQDRPVVRTLELGTDFKANLKAEDEKSWFEADRKARILSVGTLEGRKNHIALLKASKQLWDAGLHFELHIVGAPKRETARGACEFLELLLKKNYPVTWDWTLSEVALQEAYQRCDFTVYPSLFEGFGLPVLESLAYGKPCIVGQGGSLKQFSAFKGCVSLESVSSEAIASAIRGVIDDGSRYEALKLGALAQESRSWKDYSRELMELVNDPLPTRSFEEADCGTC